MKKGLHFVYIGIIFILVGIIICFGLQLNFYYKKKNPIKLYYDIKCEAFEAQNLNLAKGQIVFIGDSITDGFVLDNYFSDLDLATYNRGISGDVSSGVLNRLKVSLFDIAPSKIVLMIGTNDINWNMGDDKLISNYEQILAQIKEKLPTTKVICMSIIPQNTQFQTNIKKVTERIININQQIKDLSENFGSTYLDLFSLLADENNMLISNYTPEGLHLNNAGYEIWAGLIKPYLT